MKNFFKTFFVYGFATFIDKLIALLFIPIYASYFTVEEFGEMELLQSVISIVSIFVFLQLETSLQRFFYEMSENDLKVFASSILLFVFLFSLLITSGSFVLFFKLSSQILPPSIGADLFLWGILQIPFLCFYTFATIILRFHKSYLVFLRLIIISSICNIFLLCYFVIIKKGGLMGYFQAQLISISIVSVYSFFQIRKYLTAAFSFDSLRVAFGYALPQFPARIGSTVNAYANRFFINHYLDPYSLGLFAMAYKISSVLQIIYQFFLMFWNQMMFEIKNKDNHKEILVIILKVTSSLIFLLVSYLSLFSKDILSLLSVKFADGHYMVGIISFSLALVLLKEIVDVGPKYLKKTHYLTINFSISLAINLLVLFLLVPVYGLLGVCVSLLMTNGSLLLVSWYNSNKLYFIPFDIFNFLLNAIPCVSILILDRLDFLNENIALKILIGLAVVVIYGWLFYFPASRLVKIYEK